MQNSTQSPVAASEQSELSVEALVSEVVTTPRMPEDLYATVL